MRKCIYCDNRRHSKMSREHIISQSVLKVVFGEQIRNMCKGEPINKTMYDFEHVIKDVCNLCNSDLSTYDSRAQKFAHETKGIYDATGFEFPLDLELVNWFVKTHLNFMRSISDRETNEKYCVESSIYDSLLNYKRVSDDDFQFYIEGYEGLPYFWDENAPKRIPYFSYTSVRAIEHNILISNFRFKFLDTFILLPYRQDYTNFEERCKNTILEISRDYGFNLQRIKLSSSNKSSVVIDHVLSSEYLLSKVIRRDSR